MFIIYGKYKHEKSGCTSLFVYWESMRYKRNKRKIPKTKRKNTHSKKVEEFYVKSGFRLVPSPHQNETF